MTFALPYLIALLACAPKHAPVTPPVMETQPDLELPPLPATVEDESAPPDDHRLGSGCGFYFQT